MTTLNILDISKSSILKFTQNETNYIRSEFKNGIVSIMWYGNLLITDFKHKYYSVMQPCFISMVMPIDKVFNTEVGIKTIATWSWVFDIAPRLIDHGWLNLCELQVHSLPKSRMYFKLQLLRPPTFAHLNGNCSEKRKHVNFQQDGSRL